MREFSEHARITLSKLCEHLDNDIIEAAEGYTSNPTYSNLKILRKLLETYEETVEYKHGYKYKTEEDIARTPMTAGNPAAR